MRARYLDLCVGKVVLHVWDVASSVRRSGLLCRGKVANEDPLQIDF